MADVLLSCDEVARLLKVSTTTIRLWVKAGRLTSENATTAATGQGRGLRFRASAIRRLLDEERRARCGRRLPQVVGDVQVFAAVGGVAGGGR